MQAVLYVVSREYTCRTRTITLTPLNVHVRTLYVVYCMLSLDNTHVDYVASLKRTRMIALHPFLMSYVVFRQYTCRCYMKTRVTHTQQTHVTHTQ